MKYLKSIYENKEGYTVVGTVQPVKNNTTTDVWRNWVYHIANGLAEMVFDKEKDKMVFKKRRYSHPNEVIAEFKDGRIWALPENVDTVKENLYKWMKEYPQYTYFDIM